MAASSRKTTEPSLTEAMTLFLISLARPSPTLFACHFCHLKNMCLQEFRRPNLALSYSPIGLSTFKLQEEHSVAAGWERRRRRRRKEEEGGGGALFF